MDQNARHRCLLYRGAPSLQLPLLARVIQDKLEQNFRCLYLNSPAMVAGMRSYLAAAGVDVAHASLRGNLMVTSERHHLVDEKTFSVERMMQALEQALDDALNSGYAGLWATGDMTWELGPEIGSGKLLEYEWRLEEFMHTHPELSGICQYHIDSLPAASVRGGLSAHSEVFVNETLSLINPHYMSSETAARLMVHSSTADGFVDEVCSRSASA
jgi:hypothetical protein